jgi:hypothetical protein
MSSPVDGLPEPVWTWLCHDPLVRPDVVDEVRGRLLAGRRPSALEIADAVLRGPFRRVLAAA